MNDNTVCDGSQGTSPASVASVADLQRLIDSLHNRGFVVIGPVVRDGAVGYDDVVSTDQLPAGWIETQSGGHYRLTASDDRNFFAHTLGPQSWKRHLCPPTQEIAVAGRKGTSLTLDAGNNDSVTKQAFLGVRACDLTALEILDKVFLEGPFVDSVYEARRRNTMIVAVNCTRAGDTCFCASMGTGPRVSGGFDLALTESVDGGEYTFLVEAGSDLGCEIVEELRLGAVTAEQREVARTAVDRAAASMGRALEIDDLAAVLKANLDDLHWEEIAQRCLTCGNCTLVCPTCFCSNYEDASSLDGSEAARVRRWDSCFSVGFSYIHGGSIRSSGMARYRQWMMHKLAYWPEQFGSFGCVGCGRCITWCPAGIDITEEAQAFRQRAAR